MKYEQTSLKRRGNRSHRTASRLSLISVFDNRQLPPVCGVKKPRRRKFQDPQTAREQWCLINFDYFLARVSFLTRDITSSKECRCWNWQKCKPWMALTSDVIKEPRSDNRFSAPRKQSKNYELNFDKAHVASRLSRTILGFSTGIKVNVYEYTRKSELTARGIRRWLGAFRRCVRSFPDSRGHMWGYAEMNVVNSGFGIL